MAKWFYYNESGEKIEVTGGQLKGLAKTGRITRDTIVETEEGKSAPARKVKGLTFVEPPPVVASLEESKQSASPPEGNVHTRLFVDTKLNFTNAINAHIQARHDVEEKSDNPTLRNLHDASKASFCKFYSLRQPFFSFGVVVVARTAIEVLIFCPTLPHMDAFVSLQTQPPRR